MSAARKPTPTPWRVGFTPSARPVAYVCSDAQGHPNVIDAGMVSPADAALIVRAVNGHADTLAALAGGLRAVNQMRAEFLKVRTVEIFPVPPLSRDDLELLALQLRAAITANGGKP